MPNLEKVVRPLNALELQEAQAQIEEAVWEFAEQGKAPNTTRSYESAMRLFREWCLRHRTSALPANAGAVAGFLAMRAKEGRKYATIQRDLSAIVAAHVAAGHPSPLDQEPRLAQVIDGIRRAKGTRQQGKDPVLLEDLRKMVAVWRRPTRACERNRTLLVFLWWTAMRRSEAAALCVGDLERVAAGVRVTIRRSKTDQEGAGHVIGLQSFADKTLCPVALLESWLQKQRLGGKKDALLFGLTDRSIGRIVKRSAMLAGVDKNIGAHSMRAGFVTQAYRDGLREAEIRQVTRHKSEDMTRRYIRPESVFEHGAAAKIKV
jgi:integrase